MAGTGDHARSLHEQVEIRALAGDREPVQFEQASQEDPREPAIGIPLYRVKFTGRPETNTEMLPVIAAEFEAEPVQDLKYPRWQQK